MPWIKPLTRWISTRLSRPAPQVAPPVAPQPELPPEPKPPLVPIDQREADILAQLHPLFAARLKKTLRLCRESGLCIYIFEGMRSLERQKKLYAKGRDANGAVVEKSKVVTNARPGSSLHNYGLAADLVFDGQPQTKKVHWSWNEALPWKKMGEIATINGLEWAGDWKSFPEMPHVQLAGFRWRDLLAIYERGGLAAVWASVDEA